MQIVTSPSSKSTGINFIYKKCLTTSTISFLFSALFCLFVSKKTTHTGSTSRIESIGLKVHSEHKYSDLFVLHEVFDPTKALK